MFSSKLKGVRVAISLAMFGLMLALFLDIKSKIPTNYFHPILSLQFIPSITKAFVGLSIGFLIVIALTLLVGRVYCSSICPLGTLQDVVIYIRSRFKRKSKNRYQNPFTYLRYGVFAAVVISLLVFGPFLIGIADPYSNFGRLSVQLFRPLAILLNNLLSQLLESFEFYSFYPVHPAKMVLSSFLIALFFLISLVLLSIFRNRLFCNTLCPVGTILGTLSRFALVRKEIAAEKCIACKKCESHCKGNCINAKKMTIDASRCISCCNCLNSCSKGAISYKIKAKSTTTTNGN